MTAPVPAQPPDHRLALLYHLSQTFNSSLDLDEVLNRVMDEIIVATRAERGFVMLADQAVAEAGGRLAFRVARGIDQKTIEDPQFQISRSVVERVARDGQPMLTSDAQSDARFSMRQSVLILGLRSILCVPLKIKDRLLGVVYVDNRLQAGIFTHSDLELLTAIAASAAVAIENARLYQVAVEKGRLERELQMARQVQISLLPQSAPQIPGWDFAARWQPAREVAGDYYDFIPCTGDRIGLVVADVTDKGMPAALFMAFTRTIVRASLHRAPSPAEGIMEANRLICNDSSYGFFVTLFFALLEPGTGELTYVNAGHNPPLLYRHSAAGLDRLVRLVRTGMPLGIEEYFPYTQNTVRLEPGDFVLLYTDGVTEAIDAHDQQFGMQRLEQILIERHAAPAAEIISVLEQSISSFTGAGTPFDDITIMAAKRL